MKSDFIFYAVLNHSFTFKSHVKQGSQMSSIYKFAVSHSNSPALFVGLWWTLEIVNNDDVTFDLCLQAVAAEFQNESAAALAAAATRHLQEAEQAKNSGNEHW